MVDKLVWTPELVETFWDRVAESRLSELSFARLAGEQLLNVVSPYIKPGIRCLDVGAGNGELCELLIVRGCMVGALEPSPNRRQHLMGCGFAKHPNFLGLFDYDDGVEFDLVIAAEVIEHVLDEQFEAFGTSLRRRLRPGGIIIVTTPNNEDLDLGSTICPTTGEIFHRWQHVRSFTAESLERTLARWGFERLHDHRVDFSSGKNLVQDDQRSKLWGPASPLVRRFFQKRGNRRENLRTGNESSLIYVGVAV